VDSEKAPPCYEVCLPAHLESVVEARRLLSRAARAWRLAEQVRADAAHTVSELVANAVLHAGTPVELSLLRRGAGVRIEVGDGDSNVPTGDGRGAAELLANDTMTGRGLALVEVMSDRWGGELREAGKVMWAEVGCGTSRPCRRARRSGSAVPSSPRRRPAARTVRLIGVPTALLHASARQLTDLQRELHFMALEGSGRRPRELAVAVSIGEAWAPVIETWAASERRLAEQGAASGRDTIDFDIEVPDDIHARIDGAVSWLECSGYSQVRRRLLTLPPRPEVVAYRQWYRDEILSQLAGRLTP
jgi:anti-sigma regulatory factor (Ser/Thr protein kinase)